MKTKDSFFILFSVVAEGLFDLLAILLRRPRNNAYKKAPEGGINKEGE